MLQSQPRFTQLSPLRDSSCTHFSCISHLSSPTIALSVIELLISHRVHLLSSKTLPSAPTWPAFQPPHPCSPGVIPISGHPYSTNCSLSKTPSRSWGPRGRRTKQSQRCSAAALQAMGAGSSPGRSGNSPCAWESLGAPFSTFLMLIKALPVMPKPKPFSNDKDWPPQSPFLIKRGALPAASCTCHVPVVPPSLQREELTAKQGSTHTPLCLCFTAITYVSSLSL